jgi:hypothetical protein
MTRKWIALGIPLLSSPAVADHNIWQDIARQQPSGGQLVLPRNP